MNPISLFKNGKFSVQQFYQTDQYLIPDLNMAEVKRESVKRYFVKPEGAEKSTTVIKHFANIIECKPFPGSGSGSGSDMATLLLVMNNLKASQFILTFRQMI